jgi:hypothetical protein
LCDFRTAENRKVKRENEEAAFANIPVSRENRTKVAGRSFTQACHSD